MAESVELYRSWTVDQLKAFLRERRVPLSGNKEQLVKKVADIVATDDLEGQIQAVPFQRTEYPSPPEFSELSNDLNWTGDGFPLVTENDVTTYLKDRDGYTKNFRTGIRLCQCGHLSCLEIARLILHMLRQSADPPCDRFLLTACLLSLTQLGHCLPVTVNVLLEALKAVYIFLLCL